MLHQTFKNSTQAEEMKNGGVKFLLFTLYILMAVQWPGTEARRNHPGQLQGGKPATVKTMEAQKYLINSYSPPVTSHTKASLTLNNFEKGGGSGPSECDGMYHSNSEQIVALSTGWYNHGSRCNHFITINGNGRTVKAKVVDECDSTRGCANNIVDGSRAVWEALGVGPGSEKYGLMDVTWSD